MAVEDVTIRESTLEDYEWEGSTIVFWGDKSFDLPSAHDRAGRLIIDVRGIHVGDGPTKIEFGDDSLNVDGFTPIYQGQTCVALMLNLIRPQ